jgi:hypothetical protein
VAPQQARRRRKRRSSEYQSPQKAAEPRAGREDAPATPPRRRGGRERPPAPWGRFPLVELVVLLALVLLVAGFVVQGTRGVTMIGAGVALGSLAGLELSIREHYSGFKSHSSVLAGGITVVVAALGFFLLPAGWPQGVGLVAAAIVFAVAFYLFREAFKRRSGGVGFRA